VVDDVVVGVTTGTHVQGASSVSAVHSSSGAQLPPQSGKTPPHEEGSVVLLVLLVDEVVVDELVVGSSVVDDVVVGSGSLVDDVVGVAVLDVLDEVEELDVVGSSVEVDDDVLVDVDVDVLLVEVDVLLVEVDVVDVVLVDEDVLDVVVLPNVAPKPAISMIALPEPLSSQVVRNSESGWIGSNTSPKGGAVKPSAKSASVGVLAPPSGRPVVGSITTRHSSASTKLV
jgi:hypothetical protein